MITKTALEQRLEYLERQRGPVPETHSRLPGIVEVTAVDTGAGTCTVKRRFDNDNLIDATERSGVVYDDQPSIGDIGIIGRYGDGHLFFFEHGPSAGAFQLLAGAATLDVALAAVDSRTAFRAQRVWTAADSSYEKYRGILQFQSALTLTGGLDTVLLATADAGPMHIFAEASTSATYFTTKHADLTWIYTYLYGITDAFDVSTDSYATLAGLTLSDAYGLIGKQFRVHGVETYAPAEELIYAGMGTWSSETLYGLALIVGHTDVYEVAGGGIGWIRTTAESPAG